MEVRAPNWAGQSQHGHIAMEIEWFEKNKWKMISMYMMKNDSKKRKWKTCKKMDKKMIKDVFK